MSEALQFVGATFAKYHGDSKYDLSPVQLWPHHFDTAFVRFTGRLFPGVNPEDPDSAREQVNHGFAFGDESVSEAYFYIVPYPSPEALPDPSEDDVEVHTEGFLGYVLPWRSAASTSAPGSRLLEFLTETTRLLQPLMEGGASRSIPEQSSE